MIGSHQSVRPERYKLLLDVEQVGIKNNFAYEIQSFLFFLDFQRIMLQTHNLFWNQTGTLSVSTVYCSSRCLYGRDVYQGKVSR